jgi:penicillin-binding protein 2
MEEMSWEHFAAVNVPAEALPGLTTDMGHVRVYPHGGAFAQLIGYMAKVNKDDLAPTGPSSEPIMLTPGFRIGMQGVRRRSRSNCAGISWLRRSAPWRSLRASAKSRASRP